MARSVMEEIDTMYNVVLCTTEVGYTLANQ